MLYFKFSFVFIWAVISLATCSPDDGNDPEDSCEHSDLQVEIEVEENKATATATGGEPPYEYVWSDDTEGNVFTIEWPGNFEVTVTDSNGCTDTDSFLVEGISSIVGVWEIVIFEDTIPVGEFSFYYSEECPNILVNKTSSSGTIEFTPDGLFFYSWTDHTILTQIQYNSDCEIIDDLPDTEYYTTEKGKGYFNYDGSQFVLYYFEGGEETVSLLGPNRIKIYQEEYVRK